MSREHCTEQERVPPLVSERRVRWMGNTRGGVGGVADEVIGVVVGAVVHRRQQRVVAVLGEAVLVHLEHVVRVHEVLVEQLPVGVPHIDLTMHRNVPGHAISAHDVRQLGQAR